ncbi:MAG: hypothetical protein ACUVWR_08185 [Anaerolineae bacterium]
MDELPVRWPLTGHVSEFVAVDSDIDERQSRYHPHCKVRVIRPEPGSLSLGYRVSNTSLIPFGWRCPPLFTGHVSNNAFVLSLLWRKFRKG